MLVLQGPRQDVQCLAYVPGPAGYSLAAGYGGDLVIWPLAGGAPVELSLAPAAAGRERRVPIAFAPDGLTIAAGGGNGSVAVWDL